MNKIRVTLDEQGEPWWVAKDVCEILGIKNPTQAIAGLDEDERSMFNIGRQGEVNIINEPGLYRLIMQSRKKEAREFQRWIAHDVLPQIRRTVRKRNTYPVQKAQSFPVVREGYERM